MSGKIKGIKIEIEGETTKLNKALSESTSKSKETTKEIKEINKALKLDPDNVTLIQQKVDVLKESIETAKERVKIFEEASESVKKQYENGEIDEGAFREFTRELEKAKAELEKFKDQKDALDPVKNKIQKARDDIASFISKTKEAHPELEKLGNAGKTLASGGLKVLSTGAKASAATIAAIGTAGVVAGKQVIDFLTNAAEETREYRNEMAKLDTSFESNGHSVKNAKTTYTELYSILGDTGQATEAAQHLAAITKNQEELTKWTDICTGVYGTFGSTLPIESLTEAANETAKTGQLTGALADALNWVGESEEEFQAKLEKCSTEQERSALITETLQKKYSKAAASFRENNEAIIAMNISQAKYTENLAKIGGAVEPALASLEGVKSMLLDGVTPGIEEFMNGINAAFNGDESASEMIISGANKIIEGVENILPQIKNIISPLIGSVSEAAPEVINALIFGITENLDSVLEAALIIIETLVTGLLTEENISKITAATVNLLLMLAQFLADNVDIVINAAFAIINGLIDGLLDDENMQKLIGAAFDIIVKLGGSLIENIPQLAKNALQLGGAVLDGIWQGVLDGWEWLKSKISNMWDELFDFGHEGGEAGAQKAASGSHAGGLGYVPFNGYNAELHQGERVLTAAEAENYRANQRRYEMLERKVDAVYELQRQTDVTPVVNMNISGTAGAVVRALDVSIQRENKRKTAFA